MPAQDRRGGAGDPMRIDRSAVERPECDHVVSGTFRLQTLQQPQALLEVRHREAAAARHPGRAQRLGRGARVEDLDYLDFVRGNRLFQWFLQLAARRTDLQFVPLGSETNAEVLQVRQQLKRGQNSISSRSQSSLGVSAATRSAICRTVGASKTS